MTVPQTAFEFIFQLYNFLSAAKVDNDGFLEPVLCLENVKKSVNAEGYKTLTKRKYEDKCDSTRSRSQISSGVPQDSFDNSSVQGELTRAGYTLTQLISKDLTPLTPVSRDSRRCAR